MSVDIIRGTNKTTIIRGDTEKYLNGGVYVVLRFNVLSSSLKP